jgi:exodeoxyribonuclease VII small subunit
MGHPAFEGTRECEMWHLAANLPAAKSENRYCEMNSLCGNEWSINFDGLHQKDWTLSSRCCITIESTEQTPLPKFEECLQRLEKIVQELEKGEVPLESSLTLFEEGMQLSSACRKELEQAEGKVEILLKKNGKLQAEPFEPLTEKAPTRR